MSIPSREHLPDRAKDLSSPAVDPSFPSWTWEREPVFEAVLRHPAFFSQFAPMTESSNETSRTSSRMTEAVQLPGLGSVPKCNLGTRGTGWKESRSALHAS
jgi:hypothetical protein